MIEYLNIDNETLDAKYLAAKFKSISGESSLTLGTSAYTPNIVISDSVSINGILNLSGPLNYSTADLYNYVQHQTFAMLNDEWLDLRTKLIMAEDTVQSTWSTVEDVIYFNKCWSLTQSNVSLVDRAQLIIKMNSTSSNKYYIYVINGNGAAVNDSRTCYVNSTDVEVTGFAQIIPTGYNNFKNKALFITTSGGSISKIIEFSNYAVTTTNTVQPSSTTLKIYNNDVLYTSKLFSQIRMFNCDDHRMILSIDSDSGSTMPTVYLCDKIYVSGEFEEYRIDIIDSIDVDRDYVSSIWTTAPTVYSAKLLDANTMLIIYKSTSSALYQSVILSYDTTYGWTSKFKSKTFIFDDLPQHNSDSMAEYSNVKLYTEDSYAKFRLYTPGGLYKITSAPKFALDSSNARYCTIGYIKQLYKNSLYGDNHLLTPI